MYPFGYALRIVTPFVGVWIETLLGGLFGKSNTVTPFVGVWIETAKANNMRAAGLSHPSWVCGLKRDIAEGKYTLKQVTPFVGVWIETMTTSPVSWEHEVTPFVGVWIETLECLISFHKGAVTPFVGVWIETLSGTLKISALRHTLRGCVD